jgi:hypothetical protein
MITKPTFVGENFTRKPPKFERFIRPTGLRVKKAHVTHPELKAHTHTLLLRSCSLHPYQYRIRTDLCVVSECLCSGDVPFGYHWCEEESAVAHLHAARRRHQGHHHRGALLGSVACADGSVCAVLTGAFSKRKVNVSELGLVTTSGQVVWGKYAQGMFARTM